MDADSGQQFGVTRAPRSEIAGRLHDNFEAGDLGHAVLNYRCGQRLPPRDPDVAAKLQLTRPQIIDRLEAENKGVLISLVRRVVVEWTTVSEAAAITLGLWILLCELIVIAILWPRGRRGLRYSIGPVAVLLALGLLSTGIRIAHARGSSPAVIVTESVEVRTDPGADSLAEFSLHAGIEIRVLEERDDWVRIALPGKLSSGGR